MYTTLAEHQYERAMANYSIVDPILPVYRIYSMWSNFFIVAKSTRSLGLNACQSERLSFSGGFLEMLNLISFTLLCFYANYPISSAALSLVRPTGHKY